MLSVAVHEFGHSLGLGHTPEKNAIMYAAYTGNTNLGIDDMQAIQKLYGAPANTGNDNDVGKGRSLSNAKESFWRQLYMWYKRFRE